MEGETVLCIGTRLWHSLWRSTQQTMSRIAARNRVLYFEPGRNPDRPHLAEMRRNLPNFLELHARRLHENLIVIPTPSSAPYASRGVPRSVAQFTLPIIARINAQILARHVRWAVKEFDVQDPILWLYEPRHVHLAGRFGEKLVVYFNYDDMYDFPGNRRIREVLREYDSRLSRRADAVFVPSRVMWERHKALNPNSYLIPNAVDFDLFHRSLDAETAVAPEVAGLPRPIIGYVGWLGHQIDANLLVRVAESYPDSSVVLVGPDHLPDGAARRRLRSMANVHFLGQKELTSLPEYLKAIDVALIPYLLEGYTLSIYPLKLHEYLAAGRSVVTTALPELRIHDRVVRIGEDHEEFVRLIGEAAQDYAPLTIAERVALARENTWDHRVAEISRIVQERSAAVPIRSV